MLPALCMLLGLSLGSPLEALAQQEGQVYWAGYLGLGRMNLDGSGLEWIVKADRRWPGSIAIDEVEGKIYWAQGAHRTRVAIYRSDLDGSNLEDLTGYFLPECNDLDPCTAADHLYIDIDPVNRRLFLTARLDGNVKDSAVLMGLDLDKWTGLKAPDDRILHSNAVPDASPLGLIVDGRNQRLYYIDYDAGLNIVDMSTAETDDTGIVSFKLGDDSRLPRPVFCNTDIWYGYDYHFDPVENTLYWSGFDGIWKTNPGEPEPRISLFRDVVTVGIQISVDAEGRKLYWVDPWNKLFRTSLDDSSEIEYVTKLYDFGDVNYRPEVFDLAVSEGKIYWSDERGTIQRCNLDGSEVESVFAPKVRRPRAISIDSPRGKVLWGDDTAGTVLQANLDGSDVEVLVSGLIRVRDVLAHGDELYWFDPRSQRIQSASRDGSNVQDVATEIVGSVSYGATVIDSVRKKLYWSHYGSLYRSDLSGSNMEELSSPSGNTSIQDLAIDAQERALYWTNQDALWRTDIDSGVTTLLHENAWSLALSSERVFWTALEPDVFGNLVTVHLYHSSKDGTDRQAIISPTGSDRGVFLHDRYGRSIAERIAIHFLDDRSGTPSPRPVATGLHANYPNPFNSDTAIPYTLSRPGPVSLVIYNSLGQPVETLVNEVQAEGSYTVLWSPVSDDGAKLLGSGIYLYRLVTPHGSSTRKLTVLR